MGPPFRLKLINLPIEPIEIGEETEFLAKWFPNLFAEERVYLVRPLILPLNPVRWPAFIAGSAMTSDMPEFGDKIQTPFHNLVVAKEFLETSKSDVQWRD
jgi:hypothetical protein